MPRTPRQPGPRENRSDLPPVTGEVQSGRPYGDRATSEAALRAVPIGDSGAPSAAAAPAGDGGAPEDNPFAAFKAAAQAAEAPGQGLLSAPTERPDEPITAGLSVGAGGGPESMPDVMATQGPDPAIGLWATMMPALGVLASLPGSSPQVRQYYRRIRAQLPPDAYSQKAQG